MSIVKINISPYNIYLMPELQPHETFDGNPAFDIGVKVGEWLPNFETPRMKIGIYDSFLFDQIGEEAKIRDTDRRQFVGCCTLLGNAIYNLWDGSELVLRNSLGFKETINFMSPEYFLTLEARKIGALSHVINVGPEATDILRHQSNKYSINVEEAFERNIRIGLKVSQAQRLQGIRTYTQSPLGKMEEHSFFFKVKDQEQT